MVTAADPSTAARPVRAGGRVTPARPVRSVRADLDRLDHALAQLERAERQVAEAEALLAADPRAAFELAHRGALRAAGVVIEQANRSRSRRLPLHAWTALSRCGTHHRRRAEAAAPMVAERARLDRDPTAQPDPAMVEQHCRATREHIEGIRAEVIMTLLPEGAPSSPGSGRAASMSGR